MVRLGCKFTALALPFLVIVQAGTQSATVHYIETLIQHLAITEAGVPKCVFFGLSSGRPFGDTVEQVLQSSRLDHVTKNIVTTSPQNSTMEVPPRPLLLIIDVGDFWSSSPDGSKYRKMIYPLLGIDPETKLLVLLNPDVDDFDKLMLFLNRLRFSRVAFMNIMTRQIIFVGRHLKNLHESMTNPEDLYPSTFHYFEGSDITFRPVINNDEHPDFRWVTDTALFLNATASICNSDEPDIDLTTVRLIAWVGSIGNSKKLVTASTDALVIVAPRKRLNIVQLFLLPFNWEVWCVIMILLIFAEALRFFFPSMVRNEPFQLVVCGFERSNLHKASRWEKMLLSSLIVLIFLTKCAYETKFVSLMINRPLTREIKTIEELITSGIKVQTRDMDLGDASNDRRFAGILVNSSTDHQHDALYAYIDLRVLAKLQALIYSGKSEQHCTYNVLQEPIQMQPKVYKVATRSPLREVFEYTHSVFVESGIMTFQNDHFISLMARDIKNYFNQTNFAHKGSELLEFDDIALAWIALAVGLSAGCGIFMSEIFVKMLAKAIRRAPASNVNFLKFLKSTWRKRN